MKAIDSPVAASGAGDGKSPRKGDEKSLRNLIPRRQG